MKKAIIRMMVLVAVIMALFSGMPVQAATTGRQRAAAVEKVIRHRYKRVKILNGDDSSEFWHKIETRKGKCFYYVEKVTGTVKNAKTGDGVAGCGYVNYKRVKGIKRGSKVVSWFVYSRNNNACDDIIARYDVIIRK